MPSTSTNSGALTSARGVPGDEEPVILNLFKTVRYDEVYHAVHQVDAGHDGEMPFALVVPRLYEDGSVLDHEAQARDHEDDSWVCVSP